jgi:CheY-like chemotaxis protein
MTKPKRVLVVDDEKRNRNVLRAMLKSLGCGSDEAADGEQALSKLNDGFDLVLLDVMMPGMTGFEVAQRIRENPDYGDVPIVMVTVLESKQDSLRAVEAGANDFISKPVDKVELRVRVASLLKMKEAQDAVKRHRAELQTQVQQRTTELRELLETSAKIVQSIPSGLLIFQYQAPGELFLVNSNPEATRLTGITVDRWRGQELDEMWLNSRAQGLYQAFLDSMKTGEVLRMEEAHFKTDDVDKYFRIRAFPIPGDLLGVALEDVSERVQAQTSSGEGRQEPAQPQPESATNGSGIKEQLRDEIARRKRAEELLIRARRVVAMGEKTGGASRRLSILLRTISSKAESALAHMESADHSKLGPLIQQILDAAQQGARITGELTDETIGQGGP